MPSDKDSDRDSESGEGTQAPAKLESRNAERALEAVRKMDNDIDNLEVNIYQDALLRQLADSHEQANKLATKLLIIIAVLVIGIVVWRIPMIVEIATSLGLL